MQNKNIDTFLIGSLGEKYIANRPDVVLDEIRNGGLSCAAEMARDFSEYIRHDSAVLDVGSHFGSFAVWCAMFSPRCQVYAWEPQKQLFDELVTNFLINNVKNAVAYNTACSDWNKWLSYRTPDSSDFNPGKTKMEPEDVAEIDPESYCKIQSRTIDSYGIKNVSMVKIDVEGMELEVLSGARETIAKSMPIVFVESYESSGRRQSIFKLMNKLGYEKTQIRQDDLIFIPA